MDANRSLIVLAVGAVIVLAVLMALLPVLLQGFQPKALRTLAEERIDPVSYHDLDEPAAPAEPPPPKVARAHFPPKLYEESVPRTLSEKQWRAAVARLEQQEEDQAQDAARFDGFRTFMESPTGGNLQAAFELLRRGKSEDAAKLLEGLLAEVAEQPFEIQQPVLKAALRLFKQADRKDLMAASLYRYLENVEAKLTAGGLEGRTKEAHSELLDEVRGFLADPRVRQGSSL